MQDLLKETQQLTAAMLNEDFSLIANKAKNISEHPKPSMATRKKIMKAMGPKMAKFKTNDDVVHSAAVNIVTSAQQKSISGVSEHYKKMIDGCLSCHSLFKSEVSAILK
jgi:cytochrome c556